MATFVYAELAGLWIEAGGAGSQAGIAAAIAEAESGGVSTKINNTAYPNKPGYHPPSRGSLPEYSVGLWQINIYAHTQYTEAAMLDPLSNAAAAVSIRNARGSFSDWTTYTHNTYKKFLQKNFTPTIPTGGGQVGSSGSLSGSLSDAAVAPSGHSGWTDLRNSTNRHLPTQLARSQALRLAALRTLSTRSRVGR